VRVQLPLRVCVCMCVGAYIWVSVFSRSMEYPDGLSGLSAKDKKTLRIANLLTRSTFKIITSCCRAGIRVSIENPHNSLLWRCTAYQQWIQKFNVNSVVVDYCQFGEPYRKRTRLVTYDPEFLLDDSFLEPLRRSCPGCSASHSHVNLSGWRPRVEGELSPDMRPTKGTAAYPIALCREWAAAVSRACQ